MKARYSRDILRGRISDETAVNADTVMPPFGANKILTEEELDLVTDYIYSL
jgi:sulfur-oxidizing protein SoxX